MLFPAFLSFLSLVRPLAAAMTLAQDSRHHHYYGSSLRSLEQQQNEQGNSTFPAVGDVVCIEGHVMVSVNVMHRRTSKQTNKQRLTFVWSFFFCVERFSFLRLSTQDFYCINRGTLLDKPSIRTLSPRGPLEHSVHCLIDGTYLACCFQVMPMTMTTRKR